MADPSFWFKRSFLKCSWVAYLHSDPRPPARISTIDERVIAGAQQRMEVKGKIEEYLQKVPHEILKSVYEAAGSCEF